VLKASFQQILAYVKIEGFKKTAAQLTFQLPMAAHASKQFRWKIAHHSKIPGYATG
jgi:hypothetical protein